MKLTKQEPFIKENDMKFTDVEYDCVMLDENSLEKVKEIVENSSIFGTIKEKGIEIPDLNMQRGMHCTLRYFGDKATEEDRLQYQLIGDQLGVNVNLCATKLGIYVVGNKIMNVGLFINKENSMNETVFENISKTDLFANDYAHVTVAINKAAGAKAVETQKCFNPNAYISLFKEPVILTGVTMAVRDNIMVSELSDVPRPQLSLLEFSPEMIDEVDKMSPQELLGLGYTSKAAFLQSAKTIGSMTKAAKLLQMMEPQERNTGSSLQENIEKRINYMKNKSNIRDEHGRK